MPAIVFLDIILQNETILIEQQSQSVAYGGDLLMNDQLAAEMTSNDCGFKKLVVILQHGAE